MQIQDGRLIKCELDDIVDGTVDMHSITSIGESVFRDWRGLRSITIPGNVKSIGSWAFYRCEDLTSVTIAEGLTSIGSEVFYGCIGLRSVMIPGSLVSIQSWAFENCIGLESVIISEGITSIGCEAFSGCTGLRSVAIPKSLRLIESYAFAGCSSLRSVTIPESVESIGASAFSNCKRLTSVTIPGRIRSIRSWAFSGCIGLSSVTIPENVELIDARAFMGCTGLRSVTIPKRVKSIGEWAFSGCTGLRSITMPSIASIGLHAFSSCTNIEHVTIDAATANTRDANGFTFLDRVIASEPPENLINAMIFAGASFTERGLAKIEDANLKHKMRLWIRAYQRQALSVEAFEICVAYRAEARGLAPKNITRLPKEIWLKILGLDIYNNATKHSDYPYLTAEDITNIRIQLLDGVETDPCFIRAYRATKQSVLYGYNEMLRRLSQLGQQQLDAARLHDWRQAGHSTAIVPFSPGISL